MMEKKIYWVGRSTRLKIARNVMRILILETPVRYRRCANYYVAKADDIWYPIGTDDYECSQDRELWEYAIRMATRWGYWGVKWLYIKIWLRMICNRFHRLLMGM